jgi:hypothetical protein
VNSTIAITSQTAIFENQGFFKALRSSRQNAPALSMPRAWLPAAGRGRFRLGTGQRQKPGNAAHMQAILGISTDPGRLANPPPLRPARHLWRGGPGDPPAVITN